MELARRTRLGIPLLTADDGIHGHSFWPGATIFPTQLAMACTWDPSLLHRVARAAATEIAATGIHGTFSPVLCITRDLRWGRINETFGEDPFLIGELGAAMVRGYQGEGLSDPTAVLAYAKHFAGYSETLGGRDASEADLSPRKLRSWFLPPFEQAVRAGCRGFMLGYQSIDGVPITANQWLINDVLKGEWGFTGTLVTDWDNVGRMVYDQRTCADYAEAAAVAVNSGNDLIMATPQFFEGAQEAVARGLVDEKQIDDAVRRVLRLKFELGLFEDPRAPDPERQAQVIGCRAHADLNLETARRSLVLLRNEGILPLEGGLTSDGTGRAASQGTPRTIAVIGPNADSPRSHARRLGGRHRPGRRGCPKDIPARRWRRCSTAFAPSHPPTGPSRTPAEPTSQAPPPTPSGPSGPTVNHSRPFSPPPRSTRRNFGRPPPPQRPPTTPSWSWGTPSPSPARCAPRPRSTSKEARSLCWTRSPPPAHR